MSLFKKKSRTRQFLTNFLDKFTLFVWIEVKLKEKKETREEGLNSCTAAYHQRAFQINLNTNFELCCLQTFQLAGQPVAGATVGNAE